MNKYSNGTFMQKYTWILLILSSLTVQCDFRFGLFFRFSFRLRFANYFLVLVSFQFYSIGDYYKYVMMHITSHQHILDILHQHIGDCHT